MSRYWSELVATLKPYVPGEQPRQQRLIKLNTNESPYAPSPQVLKAIRDIDGDSLRLYPDPGSTTLRQAFADLNGIRPEQVFLGNGSDEVLAHTFQALLKQDAPLCFPDISYSFYPVWCSLYGISFRPIPLDGELRVRVGDYPQHNGGIIIPNPNAPTGILLGLEDIRVLLEASPDSVLVIDEAYIDFGGESAVSLIDDYDNLLVIQTLSKSHALAGLRVGVAMGHRDLIEALERVKDSFNSYPLDSVAQRATLASLADQVYFRESCDKVIATRERLSERLCGLGFEVLPSSANFVFASHHSVAARELFSALRERGVIVRFFDRARIDNYLRISIGTDAQCDELLSALSDILKAG